MDEIIDFTIAVCSENCSATLSDKSDNLFTYLASKMLIFYIGFYKESFKKYSVGGPEGKIGSGASADASRNLASSSRRPDSRLPLLSKT